LGFFRRRGDFGTGAIALLGQGAGGHELLALGEVDDDFVNFLRRSR